MKMGSGRQQKKGGGAGMEKTEHPHDEKKFYSGADFLSTSQGGGGGGAGAGLTRAPKGRNRLRPRRPRRGPKQTRYEMQAPKKS